MARTTCSGVQWSPWELDGVASVVLDFFQTKISLAPHLAQALALADLHAEALGSSMGDEDAWEDEPRVRSCPPTPLSHSPSLLTPLSRSPTPPSHSADGSARSLSSLSSLPPSPLPSFKRRQSASKKARRQRSHVATAKTAVFGPPPKARHTQAYDHHHTATNPTAFASVASNWSGPHAHKKKRSSLYRIRRLQALLQDSYDLVRWDGVLLPITGPNPQESRDPADGQVPVQWVLHVFLLERKLSPVIGGLARYLPKLYQYQATTMKGFSHRQPELERPFANLVYPTATLNLGPNIVTPEHVDMLSNPFGIRYSMTQYGAGALYRWAAYGYQSTESLLSQPDGAQQKREIDGVPGVRAAWAIGLLSKADELEQDREDVFGSNSLGVPLRRLEWVPTELGGRREEIEPRQKPEQVPPQPISTTDVSQEPSFNWAEQQHEAAHAEEACILTGREQEDAEARWQAWVDEFFPSQGSEDGGPRVDPIAEMERLAQEAERERVWELIVARLSGEHAGVGSTAHDESWADSSGSGPAHQYLEY
ncbi:hypothetical protein B0H14DRAFT_2626042 [Mycena olivaceomarginata]|nr:hypothetical protein B0H14DRAFT_2626042 [Mycena olivaceomarginata]